MKDKLIKKRITMCVAGVLVCGVSVGFFKYAALGVDPFQSFMGGLDALAVAPAHLLGARLGRRLHSTPFLTHGSRI